MKRVSATVLREGKTSEIYKLKKKKQTDSHKSQKFRMSGKVNQMRLVK